MGEGLNRAMLLGNLGADPELRFSQAGGGVLSMRLATSTSYVDRNQTRQERTDWHTVAVFGKRAEGLAKILHKGSRIFVEGEIRTTSYEGNDGLKRYKTEIVASNVLLAGDGGAHTSEAPTHEEPRPRERTRSRSDARAPARAPSNAAPEPEPEGDFGDLPF